MEVKSARSKDMNTDAASVLVLVVVIVGIAVEAAVHAVAIAAAQVVFGDAFALISTLSGCLVNQMKKRRIFSWRRKNLNFV